MWQTLFQELGHCRDEAHALWNPHSSEEDKE
jgi:hypothetical protein